VDLSPERTLQPRDGGTSVLLHESREDRLAGVRLAVGAHAMTLRDRDRRISPLLEETSGVVAIGGVREVRPVRESQCLEIPPRRDARMLAEVGVHVRLIVVTRSERKR